MKFLVISDTHGQIDKVLDIYRSGETFDSIIHLGDTKKDADAIADALHCDMISVKGNCDGYCDEDEYEILDTECGKILIAHGHMHNVKESLDPIAYFAEEKGCMAALFGHTHKPVYIDLGGIRLVNPGSISLPQPGYECSYAVLDTTGGVFRCDIRYYKKDCVKPKAHVQGGFIRNLLNNSDRL